MSIFHETHYCLSWSDGRRPTTTVRSTAEEDYLHPFISEIKVQTENVVDSLLSEVNRWAPWTPVLIHAGTGCGKSTFVLKVLVPLVQQHGGRLLLVSNRLALSAQYKRQLLEALDPNRLHLLTPEGIAAEREIGCVTLCNYQGLVGFMESLKETNVRPYSYVVFDEAHFFTSDSMFARDTGWLLDKIVQNFSAAVRIYMTATPWAVQNCIAEAESRCPPPMLERLQRTFNGMILQPRESFLLYRFKEPERNYCITCLPSKVRDQLDHSCVQDLLKKSNEEKWLIFVESKVRGKTLVSKLSDAKFMDSEGKGSSIWRTLLTDGTFPCRILVTTSVLDCGVNIIDPLVRHVLLLTTDHTQFIQELGRVRLKPGKSVTVYVPDLSAEQLARLRCQNDRLCRALLEFSSADAKQRCRLRFNEWYDDLSDTLRHLLPIDARGQLHVNYCAAQTVFQRQRFYEKLAESKDSHPFLSAVYHWLGQEDTELNWAAPNQGQSRAELLSMLNNYTEKNLKTKSEKEKFGRKMKALYTVAFGPRKSDRPDRDVWGKNVINQVLKAKELGYMLESIGQGWVLKKVGSTNGEN